MTHYDDLGHIPLLFPLHPPKSPLYHLHLHFSFGSPPYAKIHWLQKKKETLFMSHKTLNVHNNNSIHDDLSHSFWKGIEDMKTPKISSLWIWPIYDVKTRKNKCFEKCLPKLAILKSYIYIYISHTHTHILTKESKLKESSSYFSFLYLWGDGKGKEVSSPRFVPTPNFLFACL